MASLSKPPLANQHLSAYMDKYALEKHYVPLSNAKLKNVVGYKLRRPAFTKEAIAEIVEKWKAEKSFPQVD